MALEPEKKARYHPTPMDSDTWTELRDKCHRSHIISHPSLYKFCFGRGHFQIFQSQHHQPQSDKLNTLPSLAFRVKAWLKELTS